MFISTIECKSRKKVSNLITIMVDSASVPQVSSSSVARRNRRTIILISTRLYSVMLCSTKFCIFLLGYCNSELGMLSLLVTSPNPVLQTRQAMDLWSVPPSVNKKRIGLDD